jgi:hypothetical protein
VGTWRRALPLVTWLAALAAGLVLFHAMGRGVMAPPPLTDPAAWGEWAAAREAPVVVAAVLRLFVLALAWYLVGVTTVGVVGRLVRLAGLVRIADALTLPMVRRLLQGALGIGLATAMVGAATAPVPRAGPPPSLSVSETAPADEAPSDGEVEVGSSGTVTLVRAGLGVDGDENGDEDGDGGRGGAGSRPPAQGQDGLPVAMRLVEEDASVGMRASASPEPAPGQDAVASEFAPNEDVPASVGLRQATVPAEPAGQRPSTHRVVPGESLWSISQDALAEFLDREPTGTEVHDYWRATILHNQHGLADPDNPDLIFPGDEIVLPVPEPEE